MKKAYILVEAAMDAELLRRVLAPEAQKDAEFVVASSGIPSLARTLLVRRRVPVAVFVNADSLNPSLINERRDGMEELIRAAAASIPVKVVFVVPEVEALFFLCPDVIERVIGPIRPEFVVLGKRDPRGVLTQIAKENNRKWDVAQALAFLTPADVECLRKSEAIQELTAFLTSVEPAAVP
jgi:hypothetical protein